MTIYKTLTQEKKAKDDTEYVIEPLTGKDIEATPKVVRVTYGPNKSRTYINLCLVVSALLVLGAGIIGAIFLYKRLSHRVFIGKCGVTYYDEIYHQQTDFLRGRDPISLDLTREDFEMGMKVDSFDEVIEVSELDMYERLEIPQFDECETAVVWHDFEQNYTAIVDHVHTTCYVMKLNRTLISPPKDLIDLISKLSTKNYYMPRVDVIRQTYGVAMPPMQDLTVLGRFILKECFWYNTYRLERMTGTVQEFRKRREVRTTEFHVGFNTKDSLLKLKLVKAVIDSSDAKPVV